MEEELCKVLGNILGYKIYPYMIRGVHPTSIEFLPPEGAAFIDGRNIYFGRNTDINEGENVESFISRVKWFREYETYGPLVDYALIPLGDLLDYDSNKMKEVYFQTKKDKNKNIKMELFFEALKEEHPNKELRDRAFSNITLDKEGYDIEFENHFGVYTLYLSGSLFIRIYEEEDLKTLVKGCRIKFTEAPEEWIEV